MLVIPVKVLPKTKSFGAVNSLGVVVFETVSFEGSRGASWEAAAEVALKHLFHN